MNQPPTAAFHIPDYEVADRGPNAKAPASWSSRVSTSANVGAGRARMQEANPDDHTDTVERIPDPAGVSFERLWDEEWKQNLMHTAVERVKRRAGIKQFQMFDLYVTQQWPMDLVKSTLRVSAAQVCMAKMRVGRLLRREVRSLEAQDC